MALNKEKSEFIGMHIGDGSLYKTGKTLVWEMRGAIEEKDYYDNHVKQLIEKIFLTKFKTKQRSGGKNGCYGIQTCNKKLTNFLVKMGFEPGSKTYGVDIPLLIIKANRKNQLAFLRGYFDTDGCLYLEKINENKLYPRLELTSASSRLIKSLKKLLLDFGFRPTSWVSKQKRNDKLCIAYKLRLAGITQLEKWMKEVSTNNAKHLNNYQRFKNNYAAIA